ncbi:MAG: beta-hydroxyacyl-ACP dehydratase [Bdellovibrionales bacterium]|nr:beta-hydroxyacyl-ACP dehydratase [Bdellovibrionales bacterium]
MINPQKIFTFTPGATSWKVPKDLPYFEGHFPDNPILPAVAILDMIQQYLIHQDPSLKGSFLTIKSAKFTEIVRPEDTLTINVNFDSASKFWTVNVQNQNEVVVCKTVLQII